MKNIAILRDNHVSEAPLNAATAGFTGALARMVSEYGGAAAVKLPTGRMTGALRRRGLFP